MVRGHETVDVVCCYWCKLALLAVLVMLTRQILMMFLHQKKTSNKHEIVCFYEYYNYIFWKTVSCE